MSEPTLQELKELIVDISKQVNGIDKKMEVGFAELKGEIKRLDGKIEQVETRLIVDIKRVEDTLSAKFEGFDKRLANEETISRTAFGALMVAALAGLVKYLFFSGDRLSYLGFRFLQQALINLIIDSTKTSHLKSLSLVRSRAAGANPHSGAPSRK